VVCSTHNITLDAAAGRRSSWVPDNWLGPEHPDPNRRDALLWDWRQLAGEGEVWMCPPFLPPRTLERFVQRAAQTAARGTGVVALLPDRRARDWYRRWITDFRDTVVTEEVMHQRVRFEGPRASGMPAMLDTVLVHWQPRQPPLISAWPVATWPRPRPGVGSRLQGDPTLVSRASQGSPS
jgi:hypothetical protein